MEITKRVISGKGSGEKGEKVQGIRSINGWYKVNGEVKNSIGNIEAKEPYGRPMDMNKVWECWWEVGYRVEENKGEKKWDNCNSIINKICEKINI